LNWLVQSCVPLPLLCVCGVMLFQSSKYTVQPFPRADRFVWHMTFRASSRARCSAGISSATSMPRMATTTSSSTSVKPRFVLDMPFGSRT